MRWLLHGNFTPVVAAALQARDDKVLNMSDIGTSVDASASEILAAAGERQLDVMTTDHALIDVVYEQEVKFNRCIVFLQLTGGEVEQDDAIERLFTRYKRLTPGRLYTITESRVKIRQLPKNL